MTKKDIIHRISSMRGIDQEEVQLLLEDFMQTVKDSLSRGEPVYLRGFGTFTIRHRKAKVARNISARQTMIVPEHDVPFFKPGKDMTV